MKNSDNTQQTEITFPPEKISSPQLTKDGSFGLSVTPFGTAINVGNRIFFFEKITNYHKKFIINDFLTRGLLIGVLGGLQAYGHGIPRYFRYLITFLSAKTAWNFTNNSYFNANLDNSNGKHYYTNLFYFFYGIFEPLKQLGFVSTPFRMNNGTNLYPAFRFALLSLSRTFFELLGYSLGETLEDMSETATQFMPVSLYGDVSRLFSIKLSYPKSTHDAPRYDIARLHLGQPTGNGSYQKLVQTMDELGLSSISVKPVQHIHTHLASDEQSSQKNSGLILEFTRPNMDNPSIIDIPLWDDVTNELIIQAMYRKQNVVSLPNVRSILAPDVIQVLSDAMQFFKQHNDEQTSSYLTYDQGLSASSDFGSPTQTLRACS